MAQPCIISVTSGKGGVGKTLLSVNLSAGLVRQSKKTLLFDADWDLPNVDALLGVIPKYSISHLFDGVRTINEVIADGPEGIKFLPGGGEYIDVLCHSDKKREQFLSMLEAVDQEADYVIIDTAAGLSQLVTGIIFSCREVVVVTTPDLAAIHDSYSVLKRIVTHNPYSRVHLVVNMAPSQEVGESVIQKMKDTTSHFLNTKFSSTHVFCRDQALEEALRTEGGVAVAEPGTVFAQGIERLISEINRTEEELTLEGVRCSLRDVMEQAIQGVSGG